MSTPITIAPATANNLATVSTIVSQPLPGTGLDGVVLIEFRQTTESAVHSLHLGMLHEDGADALVAEWLAGSGWSALDGWVRGPGGIKTLALGAA